MTNQYELIALVDELTPEQEDAIYAVYDVVAASHAGSTRLAVTVEGSSVLGGAQRLLEFLSELRVTVRQFCEDFVTRSDIAQRADVSRQAVGLWVRGERQSSFPEAYSPVAGGIWLFGEVNDWLSTNVAHYEAPAVVFPTREEHVLLAELLLRWPGGHRPVRPRAGWSRVGKLAGVELRLVS